jgi:parvulin-like peptidyl-prolyl isomerase
MAQPKTTKIISKKHLARLERERRQIRVLVIGSIIIVAGVLLSIVYGALNATVFLNYKTIESVNTEKVTVREFQARAKATREQLVNQYLYYYQMAVMFGMDPATDSSLTQLFSNIQAQLESPDMIANQVLTYIEDDILIRQYAEKNNVVVTEAEIEKEIEDVYQYYPAGTPSPTPTATTFSYPTLSAAQLLLVTATSTMTMAPSFTPTLAGTAVSTKTPLPTITPVTEESYTDSYKEALDHYRELGYSEEMFRRIFFENALYREKIKALITSNVPHETEQVWVRHILVANEATAKAAYNLLMDGVDFATLASDYSTHAATRAKGGDLGWFAMGAMQDEFGISDFESVAFSLEIGEISEPVLSAAGYHILQVLGHETRPLTEDEYKTAVDDAFIAWLEEQRAASTIEVNPDLLSYVPTKPDLQDAFSNLFATQTAAAATSIMQQQTDAAIFALTPSSTPEPSTPTP